MKNPRSDAPRAVPGPERDHLSRTDPAYARMLIEASPDPLVTIGLDGKIADVNRAAEGASGIPRERMIGTDYFEYTTDPEKAKAGYREVLSSGAVRDYPLTMRHASGETIDILFNAVVFRDGNGAAQGVITSARDVTRLKKAEETVARLAGIVESSDDAIIGKTLDGVITSWNRGAERLYGFTAEEAVGNGVGMLVPEDRQQELAGILARIGRGERVEHFETVRLTKDGRRFHASVTVSPIKDSSGAVVGASAITRDITERRQSEENLWSTNELLERMLSSVHVMIACMDRDFTFARVNRAYAAADGRDPDFFVGRNHFSLYPDAANEAIFRKVVDTGEPFFAAAKPFVYREHPERGVTYWDWTLQPVRHRDGSIEGVVLSLLDVTEHKRAEEQLQQLNAELEQRVAERTAQLAATNHELEAFTYSVSHDLRAPLRHLSGFVSLLRPEIPADAGEQAQHFLDVIERAARQMGHLIDDLLAFSRMSRAEMLRHRLDPRRVLDEAIEALRPDMGGRSVELRIAALPLVEADPAMLRVVFTNLVGNALKFTRGREKAVIGISGRREGDGAVTIGIRDNGAGFDMRYADKLFTIFQRLHSADEFEGTGVGLSIVRRIVERHGGRIWAEGVPDAGATFWFTLPAAADSEPSAGLDPIGGRGEPANLPQRFDADHPRESP